MLPLRIFVLANVLPDRSSRTSRIIGHRPCTFSGPTEASKASTERFLSNTCSIPARQFHSLMTLGCSLVIRLPAQRTKPTPSQTKPSFVSTHWLKPLVMIPSQLSGVQVDSGPKLYVPSQHSLTDMNLRPIDVPELLGRKGVYLCDMPQHVLT